MSANHFTAAVAPPAVTADNHGLSVAATATLDYAACSLNLAGHQPLTEVWAQTACIVAALPGQVIDESDLDPGGGWPGEGLHVLDRRSPSSFAYDLTALGFDARAETIWDDTARLNFADAPRRLHLLTVETPLALAAATVTDDQARPSRAAVLGRYEIRPGRYLFAEIITAAGTRTMLHGIWACPGDMTTESLAEVEGFDAWQINAACASCGRAWIACAGSAWFRPDPDDVGNDLDWHYEDATTARGEAIDCPIGWCPGRVDFTV
ncbi:hypothetical protein [Glycomyces buryatensis]|uniref:Uncharacterized protein n=1 Tax=Glycomyces buryatensis TaxID=2570927 RepID=A0A4S8PVW6_9ACTN|nr:hypothetical protein [Glycomyces buryatensis]THV35720.1 hypothetical protein FAB82_22875 [Glycomyces buryatensis]